MWLGELKPRPDVKGLLHLDECLAREKLVRVSGACVCVCVCVCKGEAGGSREGTGVGLRGVESAWATSRLWKVQDASSPATVDQLFPSQLIPPTPDATLYYIYML